MERSIAEYRAVQQIAKDTMDVLRAAARPGMTEIELADLAGETMRKRGVTSFWYHSIPALVFAGERTVLSLSASEYAPTDYQFKENDMITVDLAPEIERMWADYARTIILQDGKAVPGGEIRDAVFADGVAMEDKLHAHLVQTAKPDMTFHDLHAEMDAFLRENGYENLDFLGNFGHSIVEDMPEGTFFELVRDGRVFFDPNSHEKLSSVRFFTFEPHIRKAGGGRYGFKREDIYYFENGALQAL